MGGAVRKAGVIAAAFLVGTCGTASAANLDVKVPFPFVVHGQTLPAGRYRIERVRTDVLLIRGENGIKQSTFVLTIPAPGHDPAGDRPVLTFKHQEAQYRLADIWESGKEGREVVGR